jgi:hypothetical protein
MHFMLFIPSLRESYEKDLFTLQCHFSFLPDQTPNATVKCSVKGRWALAGKDLAAGRLRDAVRKRELEVFGKELLDVWSLDIIGLLELNDLEDLLCEISNSFEEIKSLVTYVD